MQSKLDIAERAGVEHSQQKIGIDRYIQSGQVESIFFKPPEENREGPFWVYCPSIYVHRLDMRDGLDKIPPCRLTMVQTGGRWEDMRQVQTGKQYRINGDSSGLVGVGRGALPTPTQGRHEVLDPIYAGAILSSTLREYFHLGICQIPAFDDLLPDAVQPDLFNSLIYPHLCEYMITREGTGEDFILELFESEEIQKEAEGMGVLAFRRKMIEEAKEKMEQLDEPLRTLYLKAREQILPSFGKFETYANRDLDAVDAALRIGSASPIGRTSYDCRDGIYQKLLNRSRVDNYLEKAISNNSMSSDAIKTLVQESVKAAATHQPVASIDVESIIRSTVKAITGALPQLIAAGQQAQPAAQSSQPVETGPALGASMVSPPDPGDDELLSPEELVALGIPAEQRPEPEQPKTSNGGRQRDSHGRFI